MPKQKAVQTDAKRAAVYMRVSTEDQANEGYGLDVQIQQCSAYAAAFGLTVVNTYSDDGISGTKPASKRPALLQAIQDAQSGQYDVLIFAAIDRLARKASLLLNLWDVFEDAGVAIVAVKERVDTSTPVGRLMRTMLAAVAEFDRDNIVGRTTAGRNERGRKDGERGGRVPMGYIRTDDSGIAVDLDRAEIVRRMFAMRRQGETLIAIAEQLNSEGITTMRGKQWGHTSVREVLGNEPMYRGGQRWESSVQWPAILAA